MKISFCTLIEKSEVVGKAIELINQAKHEVIVTHSSEDTSEIKPSKEYFESLSQLGVRGVSVIRYIFGSKSFQPIDEYGVKQIYAGERKKYQRAIVVDQSVAMFKLGDGFFMSTYEPLVKSLYEYVTKVSE